LRIPLSNIRNKLFILLIIFAVGPVIVIGSVTYNRFSSIVEKQTSQLSANFIEQSAIKMDNVLNEIKRVSELLIFEQTARSNSILALLQNYKNSPARTQYDQLQDVRDFVANTESLLYSHSYINGFYIIVNNETTFANSNGYDLQLGYDFEHADWFRQTLNLEGQIYASDVRAHGFLLNAEPSIFFSRVIFDPKTQKKLGVLLINCSLSIFNDMRDAVLPQNSKLYMIDRNGTRLFDVEEQKIGSFIGTKLLAELKEQSETGRGRKELLTRRFSDYEWWIVTELSLDTLNQEFDRTRDFIIRFALIWLLASLILAMLLSNSFTRPIVAMARWMKQYDAGKPPFQSSYQERKDEVGILYRQYALMLEQIDILIKEKYQTQIIVLATKMKALEAQINSHFLFNTLETMNSIAEIEEVESLAVMTKSLGDMFRYSIKTKREIVTLQEELGHVHNYMTIQKFRFGSKIEIHYDIDPSLHDAPILKLILQPLVENAVYHGIEAKKGRGTIRVRVREHDPNTLLLEVTDDGAGITEERLEKLISMLQEAPQLEQLNQTGGDKRSIGIHNVHARVSLYYGQPYGLFITSELHAGTTVTIKIPKYHDTGGADHV